MIFQSTLVSLLATALLTFAFALLRAERRQERSELIVAFIAREMGQ